MAAYKVRVVFPDGEDLTLGVAGGRAPTLADAVEHCKREIYKFGPDGEVMRPEAVEGLGEVTITDSPIPHMLTKLAGVGAVAAKAGVAVAPETA